MVDQYEVIIPASGLSTRFGCDKLSLEINHQHVIDLAIKPFQADPQCQRIILVVRAFDQFPWLQKMPKIKMVLGGSTRHQSVKNGVQVSEAEYLLIHDGARPFLSEAILTKIKEADFKFGSVVIPVRDSIIQQTGDNIQYLNRDTLSLIQTPQFFQREYLLNGYKEATGKETDELSFVLKAYPEEQPVLIPGDWHNLKITYPSDL